MKILKFCNSKIFICERIAKTKSGKILRRLLRELLACYLKSKSDKSTIANLKLIDHLIEVIKKS